jgi:hypothetical protein
MWDVLSEGVARSIKRLATAHGAHNVRVLDSPDASARPVFLVDMDAGRSLFDLVALTDELGEALGAEVNVLTEASLSTYLRDAILAEAVAL